MGEIAAGTLVWCQFHEGPLLTVAREGRREQIIQNKPAHEQATRFEWFRAVRNPERLPAAVVEAIRTREEAYRTINKASYRAYVGAVNACNKAISDHSAEIEALHREECPGCPWDYEHNRMVFSAGDAEEKP